MSSSSLPVFEPSRWVLAVLTPLVFWVASCSMNPAPGPARVEIVKTESGHELRYNGSPYFIRGAVGNQNLDSLLAAGGNSIRRVKVAAGDFSRAERLGLTVMAGLEVDGLHSEGGPAVEQAVENVRATVQRFREEPSLLIWALGNGAGPELTAEQRFQRWRALEEVALAIRQEDTNHPVIPIVSAHEVQFLDELAECCPALGTVGINANETALNLPATLDEAGWEGAYVVTDLGPEANWAVGSTSWGAPLQPDTTTRSNVYLAGYEAAVEGRSNSLGSYAALWTDDQAPARSWQEVFLSDGSPTAMLEAVTFTLSGAWPVNRAPEIGPEKIVVSLENEQEPSDRNVYAPGATLHCAVDARDPEGDALIVQWELLPDGSSGAMAPRANEAIEGAVITSRQYRSVIRLPDAPGQFRIFAYVYDAKGSAAVVNVPVSTEAGV